MSPRPLDTSAAAWSEYGDVLERMGGEQRLLAALEMSESVRLVRLAGIRAQHPDWDEEAVVRHFIAEEHGTRLPGRP